MEAGPLGAVNMSINLAFEAFSIAIISASALPLGSLTSLVWQPKNWTLAFLIAFGAGATNLLY